MDSATIVDRVIRSCGRCGNELSVAERMFYFLEASEAAPLCRACLADSVAMPPSSRIPRPTADLTTPGSPAGRPAAPPDAFEGMLLDALRFFLAEELRRSGVTLERYPPADSRVRAARDLHNATRWLLETDRLREAIESLRDLRTIVHSLDTTHEETAPFTSGPDEPTIEELYARVLERANVLSARLHTDLEGAMEAPATPHDEGRPDPESYVTSEPNALLAREVPSSRSRSSRPRP